MTFGSAAIQRHRSDPVGDQRKAISEIAQPLSIMTPAVTAPICFFRLASIPSGQGRV